MEIKNIMRGMILVAVMAMMALNVRAYTVKDIDGVVKDINPGYVAEYDSMAKSGDPLGMRMLGLCYLQGIGVERNNHDGWGWLAKAVEEGDVDSEYIIGLLYRDGVGTRKNLTESAYWFRKAARNGHVGALLNIAFQFEHGQGVLQDYRIAAENYWRAAERGSDSGAYRYAEMLRDGIGVKRDLPRARKYFMQAAESNYKDSKRQAEMIGIKLKGRKSTKP